MMASRSTWHSVPCAEVVLVSMSIGNPSGNSWLRVQGTAKVLCFSCAATATVVSEETLPKVWAWSSSSCVSSFVSTRKFRDEINDVLLNRSSSVCHAQHCAAQLANGFPAAALQ
jgi:hypothetical protein